VQYYLEFRRNGSSAKCKKGGEKDLTLSKPERGGGKKHVNKPSIVRKREGKGRGGDSWNHESGHDEGLRGG